MTRVVVIILHAVPGPMAGPLERAFAADRARNADAQARGFAASGAEIRVIETHPGDEPFGRRLRGLGRERHDAGLIVFGSGSIPLATRADRMAFVAAAGRTADSAIASVAGEASGAATSVLVNNYFSSDILAIPPGVDLDLLPDLDADNGVPRWFSEHGVRVRDLRSRWRLQFDFDSPIDVAVAARSRLGASRDHRPDAWSRAGGVLDRVATVADDPLSQLLIAGRTSTDTVRWLERRTRSRTRALVEERGMKTAGPATRPARSVLGLLVDRDGPEALGELLASLSDAAVVDTRVLMAHRHGRNEAHWPIPEDRFASDLLLHEQIVDPWLRALTASAVDARIPILLGGHTLVGPGLRLAVQADRR